MKDRSSKRKWLLQTFFLLNVLLHRLEAAPKPQPQDPKDMLAMGVMQVAGAATDFMANGFALRKDIGFDTGLFSAQSNGEMGMGRAVVKPTDSDEDSDEYRRRRKRAIINSLTNNNGADATRSHFGQQRVKRAPCHTSSMPADPPADGTDGADVEEDARRRRQRQRNTAQRKRSTGKGGNASKSKKKKLITTLLKRQRRQVEGVDMVGEMGDDAKNTVQKIAERMQGVFSSFVNSVKQVWQQMGQHFSGAAGGAEGQAEAENI